MKKIVIIILLLLGIGTAQAQNIHQGYRGFADFGWSPGLLDAGVGKFELNTSHGYQFTPHFFMGMGTGVHLYYFPDGGIVVPLYLHFRSDILEKKKSPFFSVKFGYSFLSAFGVYSASDIGYRFAMNDKGLGLNVSLGYTLQKADGDAIDGVSLKFEVDF